MNYKNYKYNIKESFSFKETFETLDFKYFMHEKIFNFLKDNDLNKLKENQVMFKIILEKFETVTFTFIYQKSELENMVKKTINFFNSIEDYEKNIILSKKININE